LTLRSLALRGLGGRRLPCRNLRRRRLASGRLGCRRLRWLRLISAAWDKTFEEVTNAIADRRLLRRRTFN
jgi:hypothetical protein